MGWLGTSMSWSCTTWGRNVGSFMQRGVRSGGDEDEDISIADQVTMMFKSRGSGEGGFGVEG